MLDLFFDFVDEIGGAGAVVYSVIECERERDDFCGFVFLSVRNHFTVSRADK